MPPRFQLELLFALFIVACISFVATVAAYLVTLGLLSLFMKGS